MESLSCCTRQTTLISQTKSSTHSTSPVVLQLRPRSLRQVRPSRRRQQEQRNPDLPPGISKIHARLNSRVFFCTDEIIRWHADGSEQLRTFRKCFFEVHSE